MYLKDRVAVVTGSGRGIGQAVALAYARQGADVVITDIVEHREVAATLEAIAAMGRRAIFVPCDVANESDVATLMQRALDAFGRIDILVNGAGASSPAMLTDMTLEKWLLVLNSHLTGAFLCTREAVRCSMKENRGGSILFVSSIAGSEGTIGQCNYGAAKGGLLGLMKSCAKELARYDINVNAICPGIVETAMTATIRADEKFREASLNRILMRRFATPDMIAPLFVYLASPEGHYVHGQVHYIDGGMFGL